RLRRKYYEPSQMSRQKRRSSRGHLREFPRLLRSDPGGVSGKTACLGGRRTHYQEEPAKIAGQSERQNRRTRGANSYFQCEIDRAREKSGEKSGERKEAKTRDGEESGMMGRSKQACRPECSEGART